MSANQVAMSDKTICHATSRRGVQCKKTVVHGMKVCRFHGGNTPKGINSPHYKHGRYSKHLPTKLKERYETALKDPDLLSLRNDIAVTESRLTELLEKLDSGGSGKQWENLRKTFRSFEDAVQRRHSKDTDAAIIALKEVIEKGYEDYVVHKEIQESQEHRRKMTETENKMLIAKQQMISAEQVIALIYLVREVIQRHAFNEIKDNDIRRNLLTAISRDFDRLRVLETI
jgi:hypothetical protein